MSNGLPNAGFLELTAGWSKSEVLGLAVDESQRGSPGRAALVASGTTSAAGQTVKVWVDASRRPAITSGMVEVSGCVAAFINGVSVTPQVRVVYRNSIGNQVAVGNVPVRPPVLRQHGEARDGLGDTYWTFWARLAVPAGTATIDVEAVVVTTTPGAVVIALLKPMLDRVDPARVMPLPWDPGVHADTSLQLGIWPQVLRPFREGSRSEPQPDRVEFQGSSGRPASRKTSLDPVRRFQGSLRCDVVQRSALEEFWREGPGDFWFVEPDTERLCVASRASDGAPRSSGVHGALTQMDVALWLETA